MPCQFVRRMPEIQQNLLSLYDKRTLQDETLGQSWYPRAHAIVREWADTYSYSIATVACVIAAVSPQCTWERNLIIADDILADRAISIGGALHVNIAKARHILADRSGQITPYFPYGPKVASFAVNLAGDYSHATIDTHAMQAALNDVQATYTLKWGPYAVFAQCYVNAAKIVGIEPATFQAILWHVWKRRYPHGTKQKLRQQWYVMGEA
jgi:hypothetical protein